MVRKRSRVQSSSTALGNSDLVEIAFKMDIATAGQYAAVIMSRNGGAGVDAPGFFVQSNGSRTTLQVTGRMTTISTPINLSTKIRLVVDADNSVTVNGARQTGAIGDKTTVLAPYLGNQNSPSGPAANVQFAGGIYSYRVIDSSGVAKIDLYPVQQGESIEGKIALADCFYDFVSKQFFQNAGTGTLVFGRDTN